MRRRRRQIDPPDTPLFPVGSDLAWILVLAFFVAVPNTPIQALSLNEAQFCGKRFRGPHERPELLVEIRQGGHTAIRGETLEVDEAIERIERWRALNRFGTFILLPRANSENGTLVRVMDGIYQSRSLGCAEIAIALEVVD